MNVEEVCPALSALRFVQGPGAAEEDQPGLPDLPLCGLRATALCPGEAATPILKHRPVEPSAAEKARMLQEDDLGRTIRFIAEMPAHVCINELVISPVWNRIYIGGEDVQRKR